MNRQQWTFVNMVLATREFKSELRSIMFKRRLLRACLYEGGGLQVGEVTHLAVVETTVSRVT